MCFLIDDDATAPIQWTAWKVLILKGGYLYSPYNPSQKGGSDWTAGAAIQRSGGKTRWGVFAESGIYVYLNERVALDDARYHYNGVVVEVAVDPKDWLYTSRDGSQATYDKVRVKVKQPYIDWY